MSFLSAEFLKAGRPNSIENGFEFIAGPVLRNSDILILSDTSHAKSTSKESDLLSPEKLLRYSKAGVTDIYIEKLESLDPYVRKLERGEIGREEFIDINFEGTTSVHYSRDVLRTKLEVTADAIIAGSKLDPPVRLHFAQIENTEEQEKELFKLIDGVEPPNEEVAGLVRNLVSSFKDKGLELTDSDLEELDVIADFFCLHPHIQETMVSVTGFDPYKKLSRQFEGRLSQEDVNVSLDDFYDLKWRREREIEEMKLKVLSLDQQYRVDNDKILADRIASTKNPEGKAIVVHGAAHGAERDNDLDELLEKKGFSVSRINVVYGEENPLNPEKGLQDICDADYYPESGKLEFRDVNSDGKIEGLPKEIKQPLIKTLSGIDM